MNVVKIYIAFTLFLFLTPSPGSRADSLVDLRCDGRVNPLAVDQAAPLLSWRLDSDRKQILQSAYQIQAATTIDGFDQPDLWDSKWVTGGSSHAIAYQGKKPLAKQRVFWRVRIKNDAGDVLSWSTPSRFDAGLLSDRDWQNAKWISCTRKQQDEYGPADVMGDWIVASKKDEQQETITYSLDFELPEKHVVYAGAWWNHVAEGTTELQINGTRGLSGPEGPPTVHYKDFSFQMKNENEVSITLTNALTSTPVCFGLRIVFADGAEKIIQTNSQWRVEIGESQHAAKVVCSHGQSPLGQAKISPRRPLPATWYKKDFRLDKRIDSAKLYLCGLGYHEPYLNGAKVGDHVLDPGQTDYGQFAHYQTFDITGDLKSGENSLSILLGDGWYNNNRMFSHDRFRYGNPGLRAFVDVTYVDGSRDSVVSDDRWHWKSSGLTESSVFRGDYMDYRKWDDQWMHPGTPDGWKPVRQTKPLSPKLVAQDFPPIRVVKEIEPIETRQIGDKTWLVDLGENISGWIGLEFEEPAGTVIRIRCSEMLDADEAFLDNVPRSHWNCHAAPQHHRIIADGKQHRWRPYFSYHGFRFAEISGLSKPPTAGQIKGLVVHTDTPVIATFESSDPLLDRIFKMGIRTHLNNMHSILEDCPHREKCLWGGDAHSSWATGLYTLDAGSFYRQQARLFYTPPIDPLGIPGRIGVGKRSTNKTLDFTWSVSPLFIAWRHYQLSGDLQSARDHYQDMLDFLRFFESESDDLLPTIHRYGDHAPPEGIPRTPADPKLIASLNFYAAADRFADFADDLGKEDDARWSRNLARRIAKSINRQYFDAKNYTYGNGTHDSLALAFGMVDPALRTKVAASLASVYQDNGKKFDGGFMSYNIYPELTKYGYVDLALDMLRNPNYPGIAQSIRDYDATTIFERFRENSRTRQFNSSLDHHAMNHPTAWLLNDIAGIRTDPRKTGMQDLLLAPHFPEKLSRAKGTLKTIYGTVVSEWTREGDSIVWNIEVPPNSFAKASLPASISNFTINGEVPKSPDASPLILSGTTQLRWTNAK